MRNRGRVVGVSAFTYKVATPKLCPAVARVLFNIFNIILLILPSSVYCKMVTVNHIQILCGLLHYLSVTRIHQWRFSFKVQVEFWGTPQLYEVRTSRQFTLIPKSMTTEARSLLINVRLLAYSSIKKQARLCEMTVLYVCTASLPSFTSVVTD